MASAHHPHRPAVGTVAGGGSEGGGHRHAARLRCQRAGSGRAGAALRRGDAELPRAAVPHAAPVQRRGARAARHRGRGRVLRPRLKKSSAHRLDRRNSPSVSLPEGQPMTSSAPRRGPTLLVSAAALAAVLAAAVPAHAQQGAAPPAQAAAPATPAAPAAPKAAAPTTAAPSAANTKAAESYSLG